jgi:hypothetical protein
MPSVGQPTFGMVGRPRESAGYRAAVNQICCVDSTPAQAGDLASRAALLLETLIGRSRITFMRAIAVGVSMLLTSAVGCGMGPPTGGPPQAAASSGYTAIQSAVPIPTDPADHLAVPLRLQGHRVTDVRCPTATSPDGAVICSVRVDGALRRYRVAPRSFTPVQ